MLTNEMQKGKAELRRIMIAKGLSAHDVSEATGYSESTVYKITASDEKVTKAFVKCFLQAFVPDRDQCREIIKTFGWENLKPGKGEKSGPHQQPRKKPRPKAKAKKPGPKPKAKTNRNYTKRDPNIMALNLVVRAALDGRISDETVKLLRAIL